MRILAFRLMALYFVGTYPLKSMRVLSILSLLLAASSERLDRAALQQHQNVSDEALVYLLGVNKGIYYRGIMEGLYSLVPYLPPASLGAVMAV